MNGYRIVKLKDMLANGPAPDVLTFAGNGEPTGHPDFAGIIDDTIAARDKYFPSAKVSVLSNATMLHKPDVFEALKKVDNNNANKEYYITTAVNILKRTGCYVAQDDRIILGLTTKYRY